MRVVRIPAALTQRGQHDIFRRASTGALQELGRRAQGSIRQKMGTATDARGFVGRVDTGTTRNAVTAEAPQVTATLATQVVSVQGERARVAPVIEDGRRPGKRMPPTGPILSWLRRTDKGRALVDRVAAEREARGLPAVPRAKLEQRVAFVVARSIGRKGIPGIHPFRDTAREHRAGLALRVYRRHLAAAARSTS